MFNKIYRQNTDYKLPLVLFVCSVIIASCQKETKQRSDTSPQTTSAARFDNDGHGSGTVSPKMVLAIAGGAAAELIKGFFGKDDFNFSFESTSLPNHARSFTSLSQAARENSLSRIYVGYHFRKACMDGEALGKRIGAWIATHSLQEY